ncbi:MAG: type I glyceraldehyde-3-phosphate dehydrogenase [Candidatus Levybacteria bacterium CG_4_9_14_3_um_filter_35_16]|nr:MAG: type I glyceraldehyde-3-phosphate dehydrogenase [Candidatus Levybacteria bacterium CG22_combo_CG10-13_8_21_14_all_35_11]PIY94955.1 MAG: type I glyceraldehyde-3-phosphate dehydrogenase [Candidatus Levybacteria bacterium CG_4_10_14_0_8_um_filter_35_23]PJA00599.1 MAG: type I glyceraldehyde-3-phosphate dehydrogenase [Candidatus Levybacteria bacterium CG_4_10_14_0_2_um_filter_35_8]PJA90841.1 MAG: type I glyceraldehyde-3-phosphate dehydrogenase [Candidatus Levybacteria bacterium CG_4_9_14_3_um
MIRVAINGYGRIGRIAHRVILERFFNDVEVIAINAGSSTDIKGWMYLLKYDSVYGPILNLEIGSEPIDTQFAIKDQIGNLVIEGKKIPVFSQKDPSLLPWKDLNVDVVIESTGHFESEEKLKAHINAGAKAVILSAPAKQENPSIGSLQQGSVQTGQGVPTYILGVNAINYQGEQLINNASCTTNCIAPVAKIMVDIFGVEKAMMTTIHGYTSDQKLEDGGHKDYRRARAAGLNMIPTSTGATIATAQTVPELSGIFAGLSVRVPIPVGSLADFTFVLKRETTKEEVNTVLKQAAQSTSFQGILEVTEDPIVSSDIIGNAASSIVDLSLTQVVGGNLVKIIAWYDNEYGYANRLIEEVLMVGNKQGESRI